MYFEPSLISIQWQLAIICKCPRSSPKWQFVAIMKKLHISPSNYILQTNGRDTKWAVTCDEYYFHAGVNCDGEDTQNWPENSLWSDELLTLTTTLNATKRTRTVCVKDINTLSLEMDNEFLLLLCFQILQFSLIRFLSFASQKVNGRQGEMYPLIRTLRGVKCVQVANLNAFGIFVNSKCILILAQSNDAEARHISKRGEDGS